MVKQQASSWSKLWPMAHPKKLAHPSKEERSVSETTELLTQSQKGPAVESGLQFLRRAASPQPRVLQGKEQKPPLFNLEEDTQLLRLHCPSPSQHSHFQLTLPARFSLSVLLYLNPATEHPFDLHGPSDPSTSHPKGVFVSRKPVSLSLAPVSSCVPRHFHSPLRLLSVLYTQLSASRIAPGWPGLQTAASTTSCQAPPHRHCVLLTHCLVPLLLGLWTHHHKHQHVWQAGEEVPHIPKGLIQVTPTA